MIRGLIDSYNGETKDERVMREFVNKCAEIKGLTQIPEPEKECLKSIIYKPNPFFEELKRKRDRAIKAFLKPNEKNSKRSDDKN